MLENKKVLIIQTAYIGDVVLATSLVEILKKKAPKVQVDFLLRKGNEVLLKNSPHVGKIYIWDKTQGKYLSLLKNIVEIRSKRYDFVFNLQRFFNSGLASILSAASCIIGFDKNPLSWFYTYRVSHYIPDKVGETYYHEVQRNYKLIKPFLGGSIPEKREIRPKLYFSQEDEKVIESFNLKSRSYFVLAPTSVWFTKQWSTDKWKDLALELMERGKVILVGSSGDYDYCDKIIKGSDVLNLCGKVTLLQSALLMKEAKRVFTNDSAPLHLASSVNAPITAVFCATVPEFGYGPLSEDSETLEVKDLKCRPCGIHGSKACPQKHFNCSRLIEIKEKY